MASHSIALLLRVSAAHYAHAVHQLRSGNLIANPLAVPLSEQGIYILVGIPAERITLMDLESGDNYSGPVPTALATYLAGFQHGLNIQDDHEFELMLESDGD